MSNLATFYNGKESIGAFFLLVPKTRLTLWMLLRSGLRLIVRGIRPRSLIRMGSSLFSKIGMVLFVEWACWTSLYTKQTLLLKILPAYTTQYSQNKFFIFFGFPQGVRVGLCALRPILTCSGSLPLTTRCCSYWDSNWGSNLVKLQSLTQWWTSHWATLGVCQLTILSAYTSQ